MLCNCAITHNKKWSHLAHRFIMMSCHDQIIAVQWYGMDFTGTMIGMSYSCRIKLNLFFEFDLWNEHCFCLMGRGRQAFLAKKNNSIDVPLLSEISYLSKRELITIRWSRGRGIWSDILLFTSVSTPHVQRTKTVTAFFLPQNIYMVTFQWWTFMQC